VQRPDGLAQLPHGLHAVGHILARLTGPADLLGDPIPVGLLLLDGGQEPAPLFVQAEELINGGERLLPPPGQRGTGLLGMLPDPLEIQHGRHPPARPGDGPGRRWPAGNKEKPPDFRGGLDRGATLILPDAPRRRMARAGCIGPNRLASPPRASDGGGWPPAPGWIPLPARPARSTRRLSGRAGRRVLVPIIASAFSLGFHYIRTWSGPARPAPAGAGSPWTA